MLKQTLILITLLLSVQAIARKAHIVTFNFADSIKHSYYNRLRVIDMREDKSDIGTIRVNLLGSKAAIVTGRPLADELSAAFKSKLAGDVIGNCELVLVLYDLKLEDDPLRIDISTLHFDGDFYGSLNNKNVFLGKTDAFIELVEHKIGLLSMAGLQVGNICSAHAKIKYNDNVNLVFGDEGMQLRRVALKKVYAAYRDHEMKKGIFFTREQFLNNSAVDTPITIVELSLEKHADQFRFYYEHNGTKGERVEEEDYFAIADTGILAFAADDRGIEMIYKNGDYYAVIPMKLGGGSGTSPVIPAGGALPGAVMGGVAGGAAAALQNTRYGRGIYYCKLDIETGEMKPIKRLQ